MLRILIFDNSALKIRKMSSFSKQRMKRYSPTTYRVPQQVLVLQNSKNLLNFGILAFSTNFCPIKTDLSGNAVWPQASGFQKLTIFDIFI